MASSAENPMQVASLLKQDSRQGLLQAIGSDAPDSRSILPLGGPSSPRGDAFEWNDKLSSKFELTMYGRVCRALLFLTYLLVFIALGLYSG